MPFALFDAEQPITRQHHFATKLLLFAVNTSLTAEFLRHACCHVTLTGGPTLIDTHPFAGFLVDIRSTQAALDHTACRPRRTPSAFLFLSANACLRPT
jgi:hypothetical protein